MTSAGTCSRETACGCPAAICSVMSLTSCLNSSLADGFGLARADFHQHADFRAGVNVPGNQPVAVHFHFRVPGDFDVLADFGDDRLAFGFEIRDWPRSHNVWPRRRKTRGRCRCAPQNPSRCSPPRARRAFRRARCIGQWRLLSRRAPLSQSAVAWPFLRRMSTAAFEIALRFDERLFAIHHAGPGHFAEFANVSSSNFSHIKWVES